MTTISESAANKPIIDTVNPDVLIKQGWSYWDAQVWFTKETWQQFREALGNENEDYIILASTEMTGRHGEKQYRGQFLFGPNYKTKLQKYVDKHDKGDENGDAS